MASYCRTRELPVALVTRRAVQDAFAESGRTKHDIAKAIADEYPELAARLPAERKLWLPEDQQMNIFDAISFVAALRALPRLQRGKAA